MGLRRRRRQLIPSFTIAAALVVVAPVGDVLAEDANENALGNSAAKGPGKRERLRRIGGGLHGRDGRDARSRDTGAERLISSRSPEDEESRRMMRFYDLSSLEDDEKKMMIAQLGQLVEASDYIDWYALWGDYVSASMSDSSSSSRSRKASLHGGSQDNSDVESPPFGKTKEDEEREDWYGLWDDDGYGDVPDYDAANVLKGLQSENNDEEEYSPEIQTETDKRSLKGKERYHKRPAYTRPTPKEKGKERYHKRPAYTRPTPIMDLRKKTKGYPDKGKSVKKGARHYPKKGYKSKGKKGMSKGKKGKSSKGSWWYDDDFWYYDDDEPESDDMVYVDDEFEYEDDDELDNANDEECEEQEDDWWRTDDDWWAEEDDDLAGWYWSRSKKSKGKKGKKGKKRDLKKGKKSHSHSKGKKYKKHKSKKERGKKSKSISSDGYWQWHEEEGYWYWHSTKTVRRPCTHTHSHSHSHSHAHSHPAPAPSPSSDPHTHSHTHPSALQPSNMYPPHTHPPHTHFPNVPNPSPDSGSVPGPDGGDGVETRPPTLPPIPGRTGVPTASPTEFDEYRYDAGNCPNPGSSGLPCAEELNLRFLCDKYDPEGSFRACWNACKPSFCCIHDADKTKNYIAPHCNDDENCPQYAYCYIIWWKLHDTVGPALYLRVDQDDDFFDVPAEEIEGDKTTDIHFREVLMHHFDDVQVVIDAGTDSETNMFVADNVFDDPDWWERQV